MTPVLVFASGYFRFVRLCPSIGDAYEFCAGFEIAWRISHHGIADVGLYAMPCNEKDLHDMEPPDEVEKALTAMRTAERDQAEDRARRLDKITKELALCPDRHGGSDF